MVNIIKQEIEIDAYLKQKLEFICDFCNTTPTIINGSIKKNETKFHSFLLCLLFNLFVKLIWSLISIFFIKIITPNLKLL